LYITSLSLSLSLSLCAHRTRVHCTRLRLTRPLSGRRGGESCAAIPEPRTHKKRMETPTGASRPTIDFTFRPNGRGLYIRWREWDTDDLCLRDINTQRNALAHAHTRKRKRFSHFSKGLSVADRDLRPPPPGKLVRTTRRNTLYVYTTVNCYYIYIICL